MKYNISITNEVRGIISKDLKTQYKEICSNILNKAVLNEYSNLSTLDIKGVEVSLILTDNEHIHQYNLDYRNIDRATDVLSFPTSDFKEGSCYLSPDNINPDNNLLYLGDVIISIERMKEQAIEFGHSERREFAFLFTHSILHLLGYDHMVVDEEKRMFSLTEQLLDSLGITRDK